MTTDQRRRLPRTPRSDNPSDDLPDDLPDDLADDAEGTVVRGTDGDEVDRIVAAWRRQRPDLDLAPLEVLSRLTRLARHLDRYRASAFAAHELEPWEFDVLAALRRSGEPYTLSPGQLSAETMVASGTMTNRIDRLQARELVVREPDPDDGRGVLVRLTEAGRIAVDAALAGLIEREHTLLAELDPTSRSELAALLRRLALHLETPSP